jgi:hypothetical protein
MNAKLRRLRRRLLAAQRKGHWVRMRRSYEDGWADGILLAVGPETLLFLHAGPEAYGPFEVSFISDLRRVERPPYERFIRRALKLRGESRPRTPRPPLDSIASLLRWLQSRFDAVTFRCPLTRPGTFRVGNLIEVGPRSIRLQDIGPDGLWDRFSSRHRIVHIRRVEWGADPYVESLLLVGGPPPPLDPELED